MNDSSIPLSESVVPHTLASSWQEKSSNPFTWINKWSFEDSESGGLKSHRGASQHLICIGKRKKLGMGLEINYVT